ncbi:MAG: zinc ribbon domain-containing protein, partial [Clostridium perfringens]|nr:zinc ribbon domain-containing protein [Clostridium perfringens]
MKFCTKCGNKLSDSMKFCNKCGAKVKSVDKD